MWGNILNEMRINKKILIILFIFFIASIGVIIYLTSKNKAPSQGQLVVPPKIPEYLDYQGEIEIDISKDKFSFPSKLPLIRIGASPTVSETQAVSLGSDLGFGNDYISFDDSEFGKTYIWNSEGASLIIYSRGGKVVYSPGIQGQNLLKEISQNTIVESARSFLLEKHLTNDSALGLSVVYGLSSSDEHSNIVDFNSAAIYKVVFSPKVEGYEIVGENPYESIVDVWLDTSGRIIKAEVSKLGEIQVSEQAYNTLSYDELLTSINKASIVNIDDGNILASDVKDSEISAVRVDNIRLAYLRTSQKEDYQKPIFIIDGNISLSNKTYNTVLYLPALR